MNEEELIDDEVGEREVSPEETAAETPSEEEDLLALYEDDEEHEQTRLTTRQKVIVVVALVASFLVSFAFMLPYGRMVRQAVLGSSRGIYFEEPNLNLFGPDTVPNFRFNGGPLRIEAAEVRSGLGWYGLFRNRPSGELVLDDFRMQSDLFAIAADRLIIDLEIDSAAGLSSIDGTLRIVPEGARFEQVSFLQIDPVELEIQSMAIGLTFDQGRFVFDNANLDTNLLRVRLTGQGRFGGEPGGSTLNAELCATPTAALESEERYLGVRFLFAQAGGTPGSELCFNIRGSLGAPQVTPRTPAPAPDQNPSTEPAAQDDVVPAGEE